MTARQPKEVIFEYTQIGNSVRVTAIDAESGTEVVFQAPRSLGEGDLQKMALRKLVYVMEKKGS